jgi:hypothetical protein
MLNMINNLKITANATYELGPTPYTVNALAFKLNGVFAGATVVVGYMSGPDKATAVFCPYSDPMFTCTAASQFTVLTGREASFAVKVTGATGTTELYVNLSPIESAI